METISRDTFPRGGCSSPTDDPYGFEALVARYWRRVFTMAYRVLGDRLDAEDQTQEVFLKIYRGIGALDNPDALNAWIVQITVNTCYDALTYRKRRPTTVPFKPHGCAHDGREYPDPRLLTPEEVAMRSEERRVLAQALACLDQASRQTLVLRDIEGRSYQEIGEILALRPSAVKMRIRRARLAFRKLLIDVDPELPWGAKRLNPSNAAHPSTALRAGAEASR